MIENNDAWKELVRVLDLYDIKYRANVKSVVASISDVSDSTFYFREDSTRVSLKPSLEDAFKRVNPELFFIKPDIGESPGFINPTPFVKVNNIEQFIKELFLAANSYSGGIELTKNDITDNIVIIKINKLYSPDMSELELYEATRGIWRRKIESVEVADYCLSVSKGTVVEVYKINEWYPAGTLEYKTREIKKERCAGRIEFDGYLAPEHIRNAYIGKTVNQLYKPGEADPVKVFIAKSIHEKDEFWPSNDKYPVSITKEEWKHFIEEKEYPAHKGCVRVLKCYLDIGGTASPKKLSDTYKGGPSVYTSSVTQICRRALKYFNMKPCPDDEIKDRYWLFPIAFQGRPGLGNDKGTYEYRMRNELMEALKEMNFDDINLEYESGERNTEMSNTLFDKNMILYGPPGTGKTYNSVIYSVAICDGRDLKEVEDDLYAETLRRYNELKEDGRIAFTTFHQSYGYEEFIEGIKPQLDEESDSLGYVLEDGIFKEFCKRARTVRVQSAGPLEMKEQPRIWGMILGGAGNTPIKMECFSKNEIRLGWSEVKDDDNGAYEENTAPSWQARHMVDDFKNNMEIGDIVVIEKTSKSIDAIGVITGEYEYDETLGHYPRKRAVEWLVKNIDQDIVPYLPNGRKQLARFSVFNFDYLGMDVISKILHDHSSAPMLEVEQETKPYVFIIDEINRGNISKIFGELITLIEDTKRAGAGEAMEAILPYSGESFSVPNNVYIIGTMNTADRSIALMDTALRRRFEFTEMMPDSEVLKRFGVGTIVVDDEELDVARMMNVINERIEYLYDREHTIGHAFFRKLAKDPSLETLAGIFEKNVIPLLQEYFYEDYEKIQLVLGDNAKADEYKFILDKNLMLNDVFSGNPDIDLPDKKYCIQSEAFKRLGSYKQIAKGL